jgi:membrane protease YdiL (CAAX protease family)
MVHAIAGFVLALVFGAGLMLLSQFMDSERGAMTVRLFGLQLGALLAILIVLALAGLRPAPALAMLRPRLQDCLGAVLIGVGLLMLASATLARLYQFGDAAEHAEAVERVIAGAWELFGPWMVLSAVVLLAPVAEELLFRGLLLRGLLIRFPAWAALLVSAVMFGALHGHLVHGLIATCLGLACGMVLLARGNVWLAVLVHMAWNAAAIGVGLWSPHSDMLPLWTVAPSLVIMGAGVLLLGAHPSRQPQAAGR